MKLIGAVVIVMMSVAPLCAETYTWTDEQGTIHFTEDQAQIPKKYRKKATRRDDMGGTVSAEAPASAPAATGNGEKPAATADKQQEKGDSAGALFGGKTRQAWQQELEAAQAEVKRLDARVKELDAQVKSSGAYYVSRSQIDVRTQYNNAVDEYNKAYNRLGELIESAKRAGIPL